MIAHDVLTFLTKTRSISWCKSFLHFAPDLCCSTSLLFQTLLQTLLKTWFNRCSKIVILILLKSELRAQIPNIPENVMDLKHLHSRCNIYNFSEKKNPQYCFLSAQFQLMLNRFLSILLEEKILCGRAASDPCLQSQLSAETLSI